MRVNKDSKDAKTKTMKDDKYHPVELRGTAESCHNCPQRATPFWEHDSSSLNVNVTCCINLIAEIYSLLCLLGNHYRWHIGVESHHTAGLSHHYQVIWISCNEISTLGPVDTPYIHIHFASRDQGLGRSCWRLAFTVQPVWVNCCNHAVATTPLLYTHS